VDSGEDCDGTNLDGETCSTQGFDDGTLSCDGSCGFDTSGCYDYTCGNNTTEGSEVCDGTDLNGQGCGDIDPMYHGGTLGCQGDCSDYDTTNCEWCGDGVINGTEECDGSDLGTANCSNIGLGFTGGTLSCDTGCTFDTSSCTN